MSSIPSTANRARIATQPCENKRAAQATITPRAPDAAPPRTPPTPPSRGPLFAPLPVDGPWTTLGLGRGSFFGILVLACAVYLLFGGPLWLHLRENDFARISISYALIPPLVALAQWRRGTLKLATWLAASGVIAALKLLATAALAVALGIAA